MKTVKTEAEYNELKVALKTGDGLVFLRPDGAKVVARVGARGLHEMEHPAVPEPTYTSAQPQKGELLQVKAKAKARSK